MQDALDDAEKNLSYCYIYASFDGVVSAVDVQKGDSVSSGTVVATLITKKMIATVSLNEVDAAKIKVGQKVNLTFDAIEDLTMTGAVADIDTVGTVNQGVVNYNVTISFDTQNDKVKPGMSVSVVIITDAKQDVLLVSSGAVKSKNGDYYVETLSQKWDLTDKTVQAQGVVSSIPPNQKTVQVGISDNTSTEIISGLSEGDQVVARTSSSSTKTTQTTSSTQSLFNGGGPR
jgi:HlyD family secretion protein